MTERKRVNKGKRPAAQIRLTRSKITKYLKKHPGSTGMEVAAGLGMPLGAISRDLWYMTEKGRIKSGTNKRLYVTDANADECLLADLLIPKLPAKDKLPTTKVRLMDARHVHAEQSRPGVSIGSSLGLDYVMYGGE